MIKAETIWVRVMQDGKQIGFMKVDAKIDPRKNDFCVPRPENVQIVQPDGLQMRGYMASFLRFPVKEFVLKNGWSREYCLVADDITDGDLDFLALKSQFGWRKL